MTTLPPKPRISRAMQKAFRVYFRRFGQTLPFMLWQLVLRLAVLVPAVFLFLKGYELWALLCVPLYVLLVIPARRGAASACRDALQGGSLFTPELGLCSRGYFPSLLSGLRTGLWSLLWALPLLAAAVYAFIRYGTNQGVDGYNDVVTIGRQLETLGGGDWIDGFFTLLKGLGVMILLLVLGLAFHSGARHDWIHGGRRIRGMKGRLGVLVTWVAGTALFLPFLLVLLLIGWDLLQPLLSGLGSLLPGRGEQVDASILSEAQAQVGATVEQAVSAGGRWHLWAAAGAFLLLFVPAVPLKLLLSAAWVDSLWETGESGT